MIKQFFSSSKRKTPAQAMVEFALALPVLLLVIYGLIETGRLIFIYASVVTAARQAARYGSATGNNASGVPYYQDCAGIRAAAKGVGFINAFNDSDIKITYDMGVNGTSLIDFSGYTSPTYPSCTSTFPTDITVTTGDRIRVQVSTQYSPIVPLVPFKPFTITSYSARTILLDVPIAVTSVPQLFPGQSALQLTKSSTSGNYKYAGADIITYTYTLKNLGTSAIPGPIYVRDDHINGNTPFQCTGGDLAGGATATCQASYAVTQQDVDNGSVTNSATAFNNATPPTTSNPASYIVTADQLPALTLSKSGALAGSSDAGQPVDYTYIVTNSGNVTLTSISVSDDHITGNNKVSCPGGSLAPGAAFTCTAVYTLQSSDVSNCSGTCKVVNNATATAKFGSTTIPSNPASATVYTPPLLLNIYPNPTIVNTVGPITIKFILTNNSVNDTLSTPYAIVSPQINGNPITVTCPNSPSSIIPGQSVECDYNNYSVTQQNLDSGLITITATGTAKNKSKTVTSNPATASVVVTQTPGLTLTKKASTALDQTSGDTITYTYTLQNSGNVTLSAPFAVTDNKVAGVGCPSTPTTLIPGGTITCGGGGSLGGTYTITQTDLDAGSIINQATASAQFGTQVIASMPASATVITYNSPRLTLVKTANPTSVTGSGQTITYTYALKNTGNTALTGPFSVTDNKTTVNCSTATSPIPVGGSTTCTATYTTTQTDVTNTSVTNNATATAYVGATPYTSSASLTVNVLTPIVCDIRHSTLKTSPFSMTIFNTPTTASTVTITEIDIFYNNNAGAEAITSLTLGGQTIWSGNVTASGSQFKSFSGDMTIAVGGNKTLVVNFSQPYTANGTERVLVYFMQLGCPSPLDSNNSNQLP